MNDYRSAIDFLYSLHLHGIKLGLDHTKQFLKRCESDQPNAKIIHIAGTNGKGSTANFIQSILTAHGFRVGLFTSPHIIDFRERIRIDDQHVTEQFVIDFVKKHQNYIQLNKLTFFEVNTVMAIQYFIQETVDFIILETGMGGRMDSTNCFDNTCSVITNISLDHMEYLGSTIEEICAEKCGIIKDDSLVFIAEQDPDIYRQIADYAGKKNTKPIQIIFSKTADSNQLVFCGHAYKNKLLGQHQNLNLQTALHVADYYLDRLNPLKVQAGLDRLNWHGRLEIWQENSAVILDVSHNLAGVRVTIDALLEKYSKKRFTILCAFLADKDIYSIRTELLRLSSELFVYKIDQVRYDHKLMLKHFEKDFDKRQSLEEFRLKTKADYILAIGSHYLLDQFIMENQNL